MSEEYTLVEERISNETGIPIEMMIVKFYHYIYPGNNYDEIYELNDIFNPAMEFKSYFSYEEYNPNKKYEKVSIVPTIELMSKLSIAERMYIREKRLQNYFFIAIDKLFKRDYRIYVVNNEIFSEEDISLLGRYCTCRICKMSTYNPFKYISCGEYHGCIKTMTSGTIIDQRLQMDIIRNTRRYINECFKHIL